MILVEKIVLTLEEVQENILFYQGGPIDHVTHVPGTVSQSSAESEYTAAFTSGMDLAHFRMLIHELLNTYT